MAKISIIVISALIVIIEILTPIGILPSHISAKDISQSAIPDGAVASISTIGFINSTAKNFCTNYDTTSSGQMFNVSGRNYDILTGTYMATNSSSLCVPVKWNENNSFTFTETYVNISYGNFRTHGEFGIRSNSTFLLCQENGKSIGFNFQQNKEFYMFIQYVNSSFYFSISSKSQTLRQYILSPCHSVDESSTGLNVSFTGYYYHMKMGYPESQFSYKDFTPPFTSVNYRNVNSSEYYSAQSINISHSISCEQSGAYVVQTNNHTLIYYNSVTNRSKIFYSTQDKICYDASSSVDTSWLMKNGSSDYCLLNLNLETGKFNSTKLYYQGQKLLGLESTEYGLLTPSNAGIFDINCSDHEITCFYKNNFQNSSYKVDGLCCCEGNLFLISASNSSARVTNIGDNHTETYQNIGKVDVHMQSSGLITAGIAINGSQSLFLYPGMITLTNREILSSSPHSFVYRNSMNSIGAECRNTTFFVDIQGKYIGVMNTTIFSSCGNAIKFYNYGMINHTSLKLTHSSDYLFKPSGTFNFTLKGGIPYNSSLEICNRTLNLKNETSAYLNLSFLKSGSYQYTLSVETETLYYATSSGYLTVDNSYPEIKFLQDVFQGVYGGEHLKGTIIDNAGVLNTTVNVNGVAHHFSGTCVILAVPYVKSSIFNISYSVIDGYDVIRNGTLSMPYYNETTTNLKVNMGSDQVLNIPNYDFLLSGYVKNYSSIELNLVRDGQEYGHFYFYKNSTKVDLLNGKYSYGMSVLFKGNRTECIETGNFSVMSFKPDFNVIAHDHGYYAFYTNSANDTFDYLLQSNVTGSWLETITFNNSTIYSHAKNAYTENISSQSIYDLLHGNGTYVVSIRFTSINNFTFCRKFTLNVSNEIPSFQGKTIFYTNKSSIIIWNYSELDHVKSYILENNKLNPFNGSMEFNRTGYYNLTVKFINKYGSASFRNFSIGYSNITPSIEVYHWKSLLKNNSTETISITVKTTFGLKTESVQGKGFTLIAGISNYSLSYHKDGTYHVFIHATGLANNSAEIELNTTVVYFTTLQGISISYTTFFLDFKGTVTLLGNATQRASIQWLSDGKSVGAMDQMNGTFSTGFHTIEVKATYRNQSVEKTFTFFTFSSLLMIPPMVLIIAYPVYGVITANNDNRELIENLASMDDCTMRNVVNVLRKKHFSRKKIMSAVTLMQQKGILKIVSDPDGNKILEIVSKHKKE